MPNYCRFWSPGGTYFFTVVTFDRRPFLCEEAARLALHRAVDETRTRHPFDIMAWVLLPDHLHCIWKLPESDSDFATRWRLIKARFSRTMASQIESGDKRNASRQRHSERQIWQRRYWEHSLRDQDDLNRHVQYIHYNPVKHGLVEDATQWPYSTLIRNGEFSRCRNPGFDINVIKQMECE